MYRAMNSERFWSLIWFEWESSIAVNFSEFKIEEISVVGFVVSRSNILSNPPHP
jgi:hypothetical protein